MTDVQSVTEVARGISDYGMLAVTAAFYLLFSAIMLITMFKWFKSLINQMLEDNKRASKQQQDGWKQLLSETQRQNEKLDGILEGLRPETQLRIRNLSGMAFDLSVEQVCRIIDKVRTENHIADRGNTAKKIRTLLFNLHECRRNKFETFTYQGKKLSSYCNPEWIDQVAQVVENEIYNEDGPNANRAYTNVKMVYDSIRTDFNRKLSD